MTASEKYLARNLERLSLQTRSVTLGWVDSSVKTRALLGYLEDQEFNTGCTLVPLILSDGTQCVSLTPWSGKLLRFS